MQERWPRRRARSGQASPALLLAGLLLVAVNLRPALATVGPVLGEIGKDLHASGALLALLTALPVACFGLLAPFVPALTRRFGLERTLTAALAVLLVGMAVRLGPTMPVLLAGTVVVGGGIAVANVLLPVLVKRDFPNRVGPVTGAYSTTVNVAAAAAAGTVVPLDAALGHGWRAAFGVWAIPVLVALALWVPLVVTGAPRELQPRAVDGIFHLVRDRRSRQVIGFTAFQSVIYYSVLSWLPSIYTSHGLTAANAGLLLSVTVLISAPVALVLPMLAARRPDQRAVVAGVACCATAGLMGVMLAPVAAPYLWAVLLGIGIGGAFPLALTLFVLRTRSAADTTRLSTLSQTVAYLVAAGGPVTLGLLHDLTRSWVPGVAVLVACAVGELLAGLGAARPGYIEPSSPDAAALSGRQNTASEPQPS